MTSSLPKSNQRRSIKHAYACPKFMCPHIVISQENFESECVCGAEEYDKAVDKMFRALKVAREHYQPRNGAGYREAIGSFNFIDEALAAFEKAKGVK